MYCLDFFGHPPGFILQVPFFSTTNYIVVSAEYFFFDRKYALVNKSYSFLFIFFSVLNLVSCLPFKVLCQVTNKIIKL